MSMGVSGLRRIAILAYPMVDILDVAGPSEVFGAARRAVVAVGGPRDSGYSVEVLSTSPEPAVETDSAVSLLAHHSYRGLRGAVDTLLVAGGLGAEEAAKDRALLRWLQQMAPRVRRLGSICTGAFVLAAAGLLDGRRATTHWGYCQRLAKAYPRVKVDADPIFIRDGSVYTSAGVTAGMDLALALVEADYGLAAALWIARHLVLFARRQGGQSQFSLLLDLQEADREPLRRLQTWIAEHLHQDLSVERMAERVHMSPRNFARIQQADRLDAGPLRRTPAYRLRPPPPRRVERRPGSSGPGVRLWKSGFTPTFVPAGPPRDARRVPSPFSPR